MASPESSVLPVAQARRSLIYRVTQAAGARFAVVNGGAVAIDYGDRAEREAAQARSMGIADLSVLPRTGFKGAGAVEWLSGQGLAVGANSNVAYRQAGGEWALRLAPTEVLLIDALAGGGALTERLNKAWAWGTEKPRKPIGYPMPRADSHCWLAVTGAEAPRMFAKICGVDLRPHKFDNGRIAQTSMAKMSAVVVRADLGRALSYYVLADSASAEYLWTCIGDAMAEFAGAPVGLAVLRRLAGGA